MMNIRTAHITIGGQDRHRLLVVLEDEFNIASLILGFSPLALSIKNASYFTNKINKEI